MYVSTLLWAILSLGVSGNSPELTVSDYTTNHALPRFVYESYVYDMEDFDHPDEVAFVFQNRSDGPLETNPHFVGSFTVTNPGEKSVTCDAFLFFQQVNSEGVILLGSDAIELWKQNITVPACDKQVVSYEYILDVRSDASREIADRVRVADKYQIYYIVGLLLKQPDSLTPLSLSFFNGQLFLFTIHLPAKASGW